VLLSVLERSLRLLHPVMPHLTEELWQRLPGREAVHPETISLAAWPEGLERWVDDAVEARMAALFEVVTRVRNLRAELAIAPREEVALWLAADEAGLQGFLAEQEPLVRFLARTGPIGRGEGPEGAARDLVAGVRLAVLPAARAVGEEERRRRERELQRIETEIAGAERRLADPQFLAKAPPAVVAGSRERLADLSRRRDGLLAGLGEPAAARDEA
jgi:valyl-tRNA synthetase